MVILRPLSFRDGKLRGGQRQIMIIPRTFSPSRGHRTQARSCPKTRRDKLWSFCTLCQPRGTNSTVSGWCVGTDHIQKFCRFRWQGDSLVEWCFAWTKLVSYLYFPFNSFYVPLVVLICFACFYFHFIYFPYPLLTCFSHLFKSFSCLIKNKINFHWSFVL